MALPISVLKEKCLRGRILALNRCPPLRSEAKLKMAGLLRSESALKVGHLCSQEHKTRKVSVFFALSVSDNYYIIPYTLPMFI